MITTHSNRLNRMGLGTLLAGAFALVLGGSAQAHPATGAAAARQGKAAGKGKAVGKHKVKRAQRRLGRIFQRLDRNSDGVLGPREIASARPRLRAKLTSADFNRDGRVTKPELRTAMRQWKRNAKHRNGKQWKRNGKPHDGKQWKRDGKPRDDKRWKRDGARPAPNGKGARRDRTRAPHRAAMAPAVQTRDHRLVQVSARFGR